MNAAKEQVIQRQICQLAHIEKETTKEYRERSGGWLKMKRENSCRKKMEDGGEDMESPITQKGTNVKLQYYT